MQQNKEYKGDETAFPTLSFDIFKIFYKSRSPSFFSSIHRFRTLLPYIRLAGAPELTKALNPKGI